MTEAPPDPRIAELAPFLACVAEDLADSAPRGVLCDYLDDTEHPAAANARATVGNAAHFLAVFAYANVTKPGQESLIRFPVLPTWWPVVVFTSPAAPDLVEIVTYGRIQFRLAWVEPSAVADEWHARNDGPSAWRGPLDGITNPGWMALWVKGVDADQATIRVRTRNARAGRPAADY